MSSGQAVNPVGLLRGSGFGGEVINLEGSAASGVGSEADIEWVGRARQVVSTVIHRRRVITFMLEISAREGDKHLCANALREFPRILSARNASQRKSSLQKASRWFKMGLDDLKAHGKGTVSSQRRHGRARLEKKV
jgi:hypothetical protein